MQEWSRPVLSLQLASDEVHVWRTSLHASSEEIQMSSQFLSEEERERAARFRFPHDAHHFIIAHAVLRRLLALYLQAKPESLLFCTNSYGKPSLLPSLNPSGLCFNISHSQDLALLAFAYRRDLGVDIEYAREGIEYEQVARFCFSSYEQRILFSLVGKEKHEAFYRCWTRKEAYIKARGLGLSLPLDLFDVSLLPSESAQLLGSRESSEEISRWSFHSLLPGWGYAGAIVVEGQQWFLRTWDWDEIQT